YTKVRNSAPTTYAEGARVINSYVADGCVIEGTVENSIIFRGVKVGKGAVVENCIVMQGGVIGDGCAVQNVTMDKGAVITDGVKISGTDKKYIFVPKDRKI
ncbi:MAG: glucose-1-phosphate adenylyltransferase subunit GlgD, partial [Clostridia bacterium]|nr:glucose-1-phosphate adenylyltransferase subunit GlgD [Clostridia bacterium]